MNLLLVRAVLLPLVLTPALLARLARLACCGCFLMLAVGGLGRLYGQTSEPIELLPPLDTAASAETTSDDLLGNPPPIEATYPSWIQPAGWFSSPLWDVGLELGINGSEGNAQSFSLLTSGTAKRKTEGNTLDLGLTYGKTQANGVQTQHYALLNTRWDWNLTPKWFLYNKDLLEYNEFKNFDLRLVLSGGLGYHFIKHETTTLTGRFGAGVSREFGGVDDEWIPEANFGADYEHQLSQRQKLKFSTDYYPAWEDFMNYRLVTNANWEVLLDEATNLSLKVGLIDLYDSTPNGSKENDISYFATVLWKL